MQVLVSFPPYEPFGLEMYRCKKPAELLSGSGDGSLIEMVGLYPSWCVVAVRWFADCVKAPMPGSELVSRPGVDEKRGISGSSRPTK